MLIASFAKNEANTTDRYINITVIFWISITNWKYYLLDFWIYRFIEFIEIYRLLKFKIFHYIKKYQLKFYDAKFSARYKYFKFKNLENTWNIIQINKIYLEITYGIPTISD